MQLSTHILGDIWGRGDISRYTVISKRLRVYFNEWVTRGKNPLYTQRHTQVCMLPLEAPRKEISQGVKSCLKAGALITGKTLKRSSISVKLWELSDFKKGDKVMSISQADWYRLIALAFPHFSFLVKSSCNLSILIPFDLFATLSLGACPLYPLWFP